MGRKRAEPKAAARITMRPVKMTPLIEYLVEHENDGKTSRELILEFREVCGHDFREIAYLVKDSTRMTYQSCNICGLFVKGKKGGKLGKTNSKEEVEDDGD